MCPLHIRAGRQPARAQYRTESGPERARLPQRVPIAGGRKYPARAASCQEFIFERPAAGRRVLYGPLLVLARFLRVSLKAEEETVKRRLAHDGGEVYKHARELSGPGYTGGVIRPGEGCEFADNR